MTLVLRCSDHPGFDGTVRPGHNGEDPIEDGKSTCPDCWELYRRNHEETRVQDRTR